jgi:hypothetical protein
MSFVYGSQSRRYKTGVTCEIPDSEVH